MKALTEFHRDVVEIYGYGAQVSWALTCWHQWLNKQIETGKTTTENHIFFGDDNPNEPDAKYTYRKTTKHLSDASGPMGSTMVTFREHVIVRLHTSWEDQHREEVAREVGCEKNQIKSEVFGDVRAYRNAIAHNGKLKSEPKIFRFFSKGDKADLTGEHIDYIFRRTIDELNRIAMEYFGKNPCFSFEKQLNA